MDEMMFFRKNAILANLCAEYNQKWTACHCDKERLMRLVLMRQSAPFFADYCYNGRGLTKEYCLQEFGDYVGGKKFDGVDGVDGYTSCMYVGANGEVDGDADTTQMLWCEGTDVSVPETKCGTFYISNRSSVKLTLNGYNSVSVYLFDESSVTIEDADETCNMVVYKYSRSAAVEKGAYCTSDNIRIFEKELRL